MRTTTYNLVSRLVHTLLRLFFRCVEVTRLEHVPREGGGVLVSWQPNGMIDPALIFETFPRHVVFGARHGLFRVPGLGRVVRAHRAGAELPPPDMAERTRAFARIWSGYYARKRTHPGQVAALVRKVAEYEADLRALRIEDHELDRPPALICFGLVALLLLQVVLVYLLLPPLLLVGAVVNAPAALILWGITRWAAKQEKDEASIKVMAGALVFPGVWALAGTLAGWGHGQLHAAYPAIGDTPVLAGVMVVLLAFVGGAVALRYLRLVRETARAVRVRLTRERLRVTIARLRVDRSELHDALVAMADGLALPGSVTPEGRVTASLPPPPAPAE